MPAIEFTATVPVAARESVERLFFFNPGQPSLATAIRRTVDLWGMPEILEREGRLWIGVLSGSDQCLLRSIPRQESAARWGLWCMLGSWWT